MNKFLLVGFGNVGKAVPKRALAELGLKQKDLVIRSDGVHKLKPDGTSYLVDKNPNFWEAPEVMKDVKIAFNTLPSSQGKRSFEILRHLASAGVPVVTAEKGAMSQFHKQIEDSGFLDYVGSDATVGGRTGMLEWVASQVNNRTTQIHMVINGTLNYILDGISNQRTPGQVIDEAVLLGYAEPGASDHLDVLNGELVGDIPKKAAIMANSSLRKTVFFGSSYISPEELGQAPLDFKSWHRLIKESKDRRYILSFIRKDKEIPESDIIAPLKKEFKTESGTTVVLGGFRRIHDNPLLSYLHLSGTRNGVVITGGENESDGILVLSGEGAGPGPTATAMVNNARRLLR